MNEAIKFHMVRVRLNNGGYNSNGRYFGIGTPLYYYYSDDNPLDGYVRGSDRETAKKRIREGYPAHKNIKFYR